MSYLGLIEKGNFYAKNDWLNAISTRVFGILLRLPTIVWSSVDNLRMVNLKNPGDREMFINSANLVLNKLKKIEGFEKHAEIEGFFKEAVNTLLDWII